MDPRRMPPGERGQAAETRALRFLLDQGLKLVARNYRCRYGEIDLIMSAGGVIVFVEVRYRGNRRFADGAESIDRRKRSKLTATALHYLQAHPKAAAQAARFDVVAIAADKVENNNLRWIPNAFGVDL
jgi:putative endonuclease